MFRGTAKSNSRKRTGLSSYFVGVVLASASADILLIAAGWLQNSAPVPILLAPRIWASRLHLAGHPELRSDPVCHGRHRQPCDGAGRRFGNVAAFRLPAAGSKSSASSLADWHSKLAKPSQVDLSQRLSQAISEGRMLEPGVTNPASFRTSPNTDRLRSAGRCARAWLPQRFDPALQLRSSAGVEERRGRRQMSAAAGFSGDCATGNLPAEGAAQAAAGARPCQMRVSEAFARRAAAQASAVLDPRGSRSPHAQSSLDLLKARSPRAHGSRTNCEEVLHVAV